MELSVGLDVIPQGYFSCRLRIYLSLAHKKEDGYTDTSDAIRNLSRSDDELAESYSRAD